MPNTDKFVLDTSALLLVLRREPGNERVEPYLSNAIMSSVSLVEVTTELGRRGLPNSTVFADVCKVVHEIRPFDTTQARLAATFEEKIKGFNLPLAARACLALGATTGFLVLTADPACANLPLGIQIEVIRPTFPRVVLATGTGQ